MPRIRLMRKADIPTIVGIVEQNYQSATAKLARKELAAMFKPALIRPTYIVATDKGRVVGVAGFVGSWSDFHVTEIFWVNVEPSRQRQGIGKKLLSWIIQRLYANKAVHLLELTTSIPKYYRKNFGFVTVRIFGPKRRHKMVLDVMK